MQETYTYELVDITFETPYTLTEEKGYFFAREEEPTQSEEKTAVTIEYDADGIPTGNSQEEIPERRRIIHEYIQKWRAEHAENPRVFNDNLNEYIKINQVFLLESVSHAAMRYLSTKAVLQMGEIIRNAKKVGTTNKKVGTSNQKSFEKMIVMRYQSEDLGIVKMTVGIRNRTHEKVEYSITVPSQGEPLISDEMKKKTKNTKRKKRSK